MGPLGEELNDLFFSTIQESIDQLEFEFGTELSTSMTALSTSMTAQIARKCCCR